MNCPQPPPSDFVPDASKIPGITNYNYRDKVNEVFDHNWLHNLKKTKVELYDLFNDPFESTNLANNAQFGDKIREIREWAEAEIGRPVPSVVGQWNNAYTMMMKKAYPKVLCMNQTHSKECATNSLARDLLHIVESGRTVDPFLCDTEWCGRPMKTEWASLVNDDFQVFDRYLKSGLSQDEEKQFMYWAKLCGELCCPWRQSQGRKCTGLQYAEDVFKPSVFNENLYKNPRF